MKLTGSLMKRKKRTSSLKSSQQMVEGGTYSYLPDECWESIIKFIINDNEYNKRCYLNSLSLVSNQFLSITNRLLFSLNIFEDPTGPFLYRLFRRFTNLNSLILPAYGSDLDQLLHKISCFPSLNITSLNIIGCTDLTFPANGLQAFSQNITTLTSLTCSNFSLQGNYKMIFSLIADCFPLLKKLIFNNPFADDETKFMKGMYFLLSKCPCLQHLDLHHTSFLKDQHVAKLSLILGNLVSINLSECWKLTELALFSLVRNCQSLSEIKMESTSIGYKRVGNSNSLVEFGVYPELKSLYLGDNSSLSDKHIIMFASMFPNLELLDLYSCEHISEGVCQVLMRCCKIRNLNLDGCSEVKLHGMNFLVPTLEILNLSGTMVDDETLYKISKNCSKLSKLFFKNCYDVTKKGLKHVLQNCTQLREISLDDLSERNGICCLRHGHHRY